MNLTAEILIVEDSPTQSERLRVLLESSGYRVRAAASGGDALTMLAEWAPDLVITDIVMPGIDGYELCRRIKGDPTHRETPVILLTTLSEPSDIVTSLQCGADNYIRKPYDDRYLLSRVGNILTGRDLRDGGRMGVEVFLGGERHFITAERQQILDFLLSTYEEAVQLNDELARRAAEVQATNAELEARQVELEHTLHELDAQKRHAEELANVNRAVLDATTDGIALVTSDGRMLLGNAALARIAATIPGTDVAASFDANLEVVSALCSRPEEFREFVESLMADPHAEGSFELELEGSSQWLHVFGAPVRDASDELIGRIFVLRDITREREVDRLKSEVIAMVSHELRTPLTGILGYAGLLSADDVDEQSRREYVAIISGEARRLSLLLNDFLDLQRIEAGLFDIKREPVPVAELLHRQARIFEGQSDVHEVRIEVSDASLVAGGDTGRLAQVVANLLSNAIKYSPDGGTVELRADERDGCVEVSVRDRGIGIGPEHHDRMFEKFYRVDCDATRRIRGTGLGLALSREIVEAHGGEMGFDSVEGAGSTFWFRVPLAAGTAPTGAVAGVQAL